MLINSGIEEEAFGGCISAALMQSNGIDYVPEVRAAFCPGWI
jgi:hypothetical protein